MGERTKAVLIVWALFVLVLIAAFGSLAAVEIWGCDCPTSLKEQDHD